MVSKSALKKLAQEHGTPLFVVDHDELRKNYAAFKKHMSFFPMSNKVVAAHAAALAPYLASKGTVQFTVEKPLPTALVKKIVKARIAENAAKAPTRMPRQTKDQSSWRREKISRSSRSQARCGVITINARR